jgi:hemerythrin-like domain-containing protein
MRHPADRPLRRRLITAGLALTTGAAVGLAGCGKGGDKAAEAPSDGLSPTERLMRGHGLLRRLTALFREAAPNLRINPGAIDLQAMVQATDLFHAFVSDFQEKALEEAIVFPAVETAGGDPGALVRTLVIQHERGREILAYVKERCSRGVIGIADSEPLARALESMARMYEEHTAIEETVVFPAWRKTLSPGQLEEAGGQFQTLEQERFKGGFDQAVSDVRQVEQRVGLVHLHLFTASPPASDAPAPVKEPRRG